MFDRFRERLALVAAAAPRAYWYVWWGTLVNRLGGFVIPLLTMYLIEVRKLSVAEAGGIVSVFGAGSVAASIAGGYFSDRIGRRATMAISMFGGAIAMTALGFAHDLTTITVMVGVVGFVGELYRPAVLAFVADVMPPAQRIHAYGMLHWVINVGFAVASVVGGLLAELDFTILFLADAATMAAYGVIVLVAVPETRPARGAASSANTSANTTASAAPAVAAEALAAPRSRSWLADGPFVVLLALTLLLALLPFQSGSALPAHMSQQGFTAAGFGAVMAVNGALIIVLQPWLTAWSSTRDPSRILVISALCYGAGFSMHGLGAELWTHAAAVMVWTIGEILESPTRSTIVAAMAPAESRGRYQGATVMAFGLAQLVAPRLGTWVLEHLGSDMLWVSCLGLGGIAALGHAAATPARRRRIGTHGASRGGSTRGPASAKDRP
jgi:MFS family permease